MRNAIAAAITLAALSFPLAAQAASECGDAPKDQWMNEEALKVKATELGYDVRSVKVEDGCYEAYAMDKDGKKVEAYFNPVTGDVVKTKIKG